MLLAFIVVIVVIVVGVGLRDGVADGAAVEVELVDEFFADEDLNARRWVVGNGGIVAGEDAGVVGDLIS